MNQNDRQRRNYKLNCACVCLCSNHLGCVDLWFNSYILITYYRVFCVRHHSKNTFYSLSLSLSDIRLNQGNDDDDPVLTGTVLLTLSSTWNYVGVISRWLCFALHLRAHVCVFVCDVCVWNCVSVCEHI